MTEFPKRKHKGEEEPSPMPSLCHAPGNTTVSIRVDRSWQASVANCVRENDGELKTSGKKHVEVFDGHLFHYGIVFLKNSVSKFLLLLLQ